MQKQRLPSGQYDLVLSIGRKCQPAGRLKRFGVRDFSGPFDWFANMKLRQVHFILENGCDHIFNAENVDVVGAEKGSLHFKDKAYSMISMHDVPDTVPFEELHSRIDSLRATIERRRQNFIANIEKSKRVLLIRLGRENTGELSAFSEFLKQRFPTTAVDILVIVEKPGKPIKTTISKIDNVYFISGDNTPNQDEWLGSDKLWQTALCRVRRGSRRPIGIDHRTPPRPKKRRIPLRATATQSPKSREAKSLVQLLYRRVKRYARKLRRFFGSA